MTAPSQVDWNTTLTGSRKASGALVAGWSFIETSLSGYVEAPLKKNESLSTVDKITDANIILVSAPGAVGKSTLARQVSCAAEALYIDLAGSEPVGGNFVSGGIFRSKLSGAWDAGTLAILIDGLDEARLRVTQDSFESFLADVATLAREAKLPIILFGRTGSIEDAWLELSRLPTALHVLEIDFFNKEAALEFAKTRLAFKKPQTAHRAAEIEALDLALSELRGRTQSDGDRFAGYAPVLEAVVDRVVSESNPAALVAALKAGEQPVTLSTIVTAILERERAKLRPIQFSNPHIADNLYNGKEQLAYLASRIYGLPEPQLPSIPSEDLEKYSNALQVWVAEHPFLAGNSKASSTVFGAMIAAHALADPEHGTLAQDKELLLGKVANPFLIEFFIEQFPENSAFTVASELVGILYASLRAQLAFADVGRLYVDSSEDDDNAPAEGEMSVLREGAQSPRRLEFFTPRDGLFRMGSYVEGVQLFTPSAHVEFGPGPDTQILAPTSIVAKRLSLQSPSVVFEAPQSTGENSIVLVADHLSTTNVQKGLTIRGKVDLRVSWPNARNFPWTSYASEPVQPEHPELDEGLRRFRHYVIAFRSHSKGQLARYRRKIEHGRMTKGKGQAVLDALKEDEIIVLDGQMYFLDADRLGAVTGATYADAVARQFNSKTVDYIAAAIR